MRTLLAAAAASAVATSAFAVPTPITGLTTDNGDPPEVTTTGTLVTSFSSGGLTNSNLIAPTSVSASSNANQGLPIYGINGAVTAGVGTTGDLDVANGLANPIQPAGAFVDYQFGRTFDAAGTAGVGNDFFILELGSARGTALAGDDVLLIQPLDETGGVINVLNGVTTISLTVLDFGDTGKDIRFRLNGSSESPASPRNIAGVGFDVSDFGDAALFGGISGFRITSPATGQSGIDPLVVGANIVPEPASAALLAAGLGLLASRRRRAA